MPVVVVWGNNYIAKKLAESLVGESVWVIGKKGLIEEETSQNSQSVGSVEEIEDKIDYIFDFEAEKECLVKAEANQARLVEVAINNLGQELLEKLRNVDCDWRLICGFDVYGPEMERGSNWVAKLLESAVVNSDLVLPKDIGNLRCIEIRDFVEVLKKACFVPGISAERLIVGGKQTRIEDICKIMVSKAKMTKKGLVVEENGWQEIDEEVIKDSWKKIGWDGGEDFSSRVGDSLKYFFEKIDLILREKRKGGEINQTKENKPGYEIEIEEAGEEKETNNDQFPISNLQSLVKQIEDKQDVGIATETRKEEKEVKGKVEEVYLHQDSGGQVEIETEDVGEEEEMVGKVLSKQSGLVWSPKPRRVIKKKKKKSKEIVEKREVDWGEMVAKVEDKVFDRKEEKVEEVKRKKVKIKWKWVALPILVAIILVGGIVANFFWSLVRVGYEVEKSKVYIEERKVEELKQMADKNLAKIDSLKKQLPIVSVEGRLFSYKGVMEVLRVMETVWTTEMEMADFFDKTEVISQAIFGEGEIDWDKTKEEMIDKLDYLEVNLGMIEARTSGDWSFLPGRLRLMVSKESKRASEYRQLISKIRGSMDLVYYLLGADGARRDFLVLLQNEMELRPNGGFIGSYGVMSVENGRLLRLDVGDIYDIDGQLKGHVEPPKPIKEILNEPSWYLRDANWQADFTNSARDIEWFFKKETGRNIDGVISVNLAAAKLLVGAIGEVWVADFNEKVTADNLYEQAQFHSEKGYFAGSRQKSMFLGKLTSQLVEEIKNASKMKQFLVIKALLTGLDENEIQIWPKDSQSRQLVADMGWDGSMYSGECGIENCLADYLYLVEANLGVNKSNYFLKRSVEGLVEISNRAVSRVMRINYENTARNTTWPGGDYKNYMRVYLPADINLAQISIYEPNDLAGRKILTKEEMEITNKEDKTEIAFLVTVPVTKKRVVEIKYSSQIDINLANEFSYLNYIQKQSGYGETPATLLISFPQGWQPIQVEPVATVVNGKLLFDQKFRQDIKMGVVVGK